MSKQSQGLIQLRGVNLTFPSSGAAACQEVDLTLSPGEIRGLVGENGAGKTTLGKILQGACPPDSGWLFLEGKEVDLARRPPGPLPRVGMVQQRGIWAPGLRIWENAALGRRGRGFPRGRRGWIHRLSQVIQDYSLEVDPQAFTGKMDATVLQRAELASALVEDPSLLILDEPAVTGIEGLSLTPFLSRLQDEGKTILLITHRLPSVFKNADFVTVMRAGRVLETLPAQESQADRLASLMFGQEREAGEDFQENPPPTDSDPQAGIRLQLKGISLKERGVPVLDQVNLTLRSGEILGILGLREEGLGALEELLAGALAPDGGEIHLQGRRILSLSPPGFRKAGLAYVPTDRMGRGASLSSTISENLLLHNAARIAGRGGWLSPSRVARWTRQRQKEGTLAGHPGQPLGELSGGNIQKVILERELQENPGILVIAEPAWGLDERYRRKLYRRLQALRDRGSGVILLTTSLDEALELTDQLGVLSGGRLSPVKAVREWTRQELLQRIAEK